MPKNNLARFLYTFLIFFFSYVFFIEVFILAIDILFCFWGICRVSIYIPSLDLLIAMLILAFFMSIYYLYSRRK